MPFLTLVPVWIRIELQATNGRMELLILHLHTVAVQEIINEWVISIHCMTLLNRQKEITVQSCTSRARVSLRRRPVLKRVVRYLDRGAGTFLCTVLTMESLIVMLLCVFGGLARAREYSDTSLYNYDMIRCFLYRRRDNILKLVQKELSYIIYWGGFPVRRLTFDMWTNVLALCIVRNIH